MMIDGGKMAPPSEVAPFLKMAPLFSQCISIQHEGRSGDSSMQGDRATAWSDGLTSTGEG